jgi:hypothetical protein
MSCLKVSLAPSIASHRPLTAFIFRYLENFFCRDESTFLFKAFRLFHLLLVYVDPQVLVPPPPTLLTSLAGAPFGGAAFSPRVVFSPVVSDPL